jgi:hypothetical protein
MKISKVHLLSNEFQKETGPVIRDVTIPDYNESWSLMKLLNKIHFHGQVSIGDVIEFENDYYLICNLGFRSLTGDEFKSFASLNRYDRVFHPLLDESNV